MVAVMDEVFDCSTKLSDQNSPNSYNQILK